MNILSTTYHIKEMLYVTTCRKTIFKIVLYVSLFLLAILLLLLPQFLHKEHYISRREKRFPTDLKYILFWSPLRGRKKHERPEFTPGQTSFIDQKCSHINCYVTYKKTFLQNDVSNFDAIVFNVQDLSKITTDNLNLTRLPHQNYVFRAQESSQKHPLCNHLFENFFNLTWTYKLISDIPQPFINIYDKNNTLVGPKRKVDWIKKMNHTDTFAKKMLSKHKGVAWIVTKCTNKLKHLDFITDLRNELKGYNYTLDIYGPCGDSKCSDQSMLSCYRMVEKSYFFQLILEEYFSHDYVTEDLVKSLNYFTIPITRGGANYSRFLPPGSYINANNFDVKKLGALLDYLIKNPIMYEFFFDWKNYYFYTIRPRSEICDLCTALNDNSSVPRTYKHFRHWWNHDFKDICGRMQLLDLFKS